MIIPTFLRLTSGAGKNFSEITIFWKFSKKASFFEKKFRLFGIRRDPCIYITDNCIVMPNWFNFLAVFMASSIFQSINTRFLKLPPFSQAQTQTNKKLGHGYYGPPCHLPPAAIRHLEATEEKVAEERSFSFS